MQNSTAFSFPRKKGNNVTLTINNIVGTNYAYYSWMSANLMSQAIALDDIPVRGMRVLELGAGTGLCGFTAVLCSAQWVTFSDLDLKAVIDNLNINADQNSITTFDFCPTNWTELPSKLLDIAFDIILAADCLFAKEVFRPFVETLSLLLHKNSNAVAYIAYENRGSNTDFVSMFARVGLHIVVHPSTIFDCERFYLFKVTLTRE